MTKQLREFKPYLRKSNEAMKPMHFSKQIT